MRYKLLFICFLNCIFTQYVFSQSLDQPDGMYRRALIDIQNGNTDSGYDKLHNAYVEYTDILKSIDTIHIEYNRLITRMADVFENLYQGVAYYYMEKKDMPKTIKLAEAYIKLAWLPKMYKKKLMEHPDYPVIAYMVGREAYINKEYANAIPYLRAYLSTKHEDHRKTAFQILSMAYHELKNHTDCMAIVASGLVQYPDDINLLLVGSESARHAQDYYKMRAWLYKLNELRPNNLNLIKNLAVMHEKHNDYDEAIAMYCKLDSLKPNQLENTYHLATNYYEAGVSTYNLGIKEKNKNIKESHFNKAKKYMTQAMPYLTSALNNIDMLVDSLKLFKGSNMSKEEVGTIILKARGICSEVTKTNNKAKLPTQQIAMVSLNSKPEGTSNKNSNSIFTTGEEERILSDVDVDIPLSASPNRLKNTYAVIIGNENYKHHAKVKYAHNDCTTFAQYCEQLLSIPKENIRTIKDATLAEIEEQVRYITSKSDMNPGALRFIFYYAGHGIPDMSVGKAYILPTDATGTDFRSCYSLDELYAKFDALNAKDVIVFLDACFSGGTGSGEMLFSERYVAVEPEEPETPSKTIVFSATKGDQTAMPYDEKQHGFFTYYLLKTLKDTKGDVTLEQLAQSIQKQVDNMAFDKNNKRQTPQVKPAVSFGDSWKNMKLIE